MAFRRLEALEELRRDFVRNEILSTDPMHRESGHETLAFLEEQYGPLIGSLPTWHPLHLDVQVASGAERFKRSVYDIFGHDICDHTWSFAEGLLFMPYNTKAKEQAEDKLDELFGNHVDPLEKPFGTSKRCMFRVDKIDGVLHAPACTLIVFTHNFWTYAETLESSISHCKQKLRRALQWMENNSWTYCGEAWDHIADDMLGGPRGAISSTYVDENLGKRIKIIHEALNKAEYHGSVRTDTYVGPSHLAPKYVRRVSKWHHDETEKLEDLEEARAEATRLDAIKAHEKHLTTEAAGLE